MVTHASILAWNIPRTEDPGGQDPSGPRELDTTEQPSTRHQQQWKSAAIMGLKGEGEEARAGDLAWARHT